MIVAISHCFLHDYRTITRTIATSHAQNHPLLNPAKKAISAKQGQKSTVAVTVTVTPSEKKPPKPTRHRDVPEQRKSNTGDYIHTHTHTHTHTHEKQMFHSSIHHQPTPIQLPKIALHLRSLIHRPILPISPQREIII